MEKEIPFENSGLFSGHVHQMCGDADKIYTSVENIKAIAQGRCNYALYNRKYLSFSKPHQTISTIFVKKGEFNAFSHQDKLNVSSLQV